jgi:hypothetical protein
MASLVTENNNTDSVDKESVINDIKTLIKDEQVLEAVELLKKTFDATEIDELAQSNKYIHFAKQCKEEISSLLSELDPIKTTSSNESSDASGWVAVNAETEKYRVWYKEETKTSSYTFRVEGMVNAPLFNILSVIYEFDLFKTWFPGISESSKDIQLAKFRFIVSLLGMSLPWPIWRRKSILYAYGDVLNSESVAIYIREARETDLTQNITNTYGDSTTTENNDATDKKEKEKIVVDETKYVNAKCLYGGFHVIPVTEDKTFVKFVFNFDPQFQLLPASFFNYIVQQTMIPLLGLLTKKAKNIEGTEYEKRINSQEKSLIYAEIRKRLTKIDYKGKAYEKYLLQSQIKIIEERLAKAAKEEEKQKVKS